MTNKTFLFVLYAQGKQGRKTDLLCVMHPFEAAANAYCAYVQNRRGSFGKQPRHWRNCLASPCAKIFAL